MRTVVVRYQTKPECANENQQLVEKVFAELAERRPAGFGYVTFRLEDGTSFVHIVHETAEDAEALTDMPAFQSFAAAVGERCVQPPVAMSAQIVGVYQFEPRIRK